MTATEVVSGDDEPALWATRSRTMPPTPAGARIAPMAPFAPGRAGAPPQPVGSTEDKLAEARHRLAQAKQHLQEKKERQQSLQQRITTLEAVHPPAPALPTDGSSGQAAGESVTRVEPLSPQASLPPSAPTSASSSVRPSGSRLEGFADDGLVAVPFSEASSDGE